MLKPPLPMDEAGRIEALRSYDVLDTPPEEAFDDLTRLASQICGTPMAMISLIDEDRQWYKSKVGTDLKETSRDVAFCAHAMLAPDLFIVPDAREDERFSDNPLVTAGPQVRFYAGAPLVTPEGQPLGSLCAVDRVPHQLTPEQEEALRALARQAMTQLRLRRALKQLQELERLRDSLTHMIVHDMRTPLTGLLGGLQTLELMGSLNEEQRQVLELSLDGAGVLMRMINDLLDVHKMEEGSLTLERAELNVQDVTAQALRQVALVAAERQVGVSEEVAPDAARVYAEEDKLVRILVNLLGNALHFTPAGGRVNLSVRRSEPDQALLFSVTDTGEGIPADAFERIFEKFGQVGTSRTGREHSTGLGLTFCKMAVEAHGGRIWVESEPGQGSTFSFTIPFRRTAGD